MNWDAFLAAIIITSMALFFAWGIGKLTRVEFSDSGMGSDSGTKCQDDSPE